MKSAVASDVDDSSREYMAFTASQWLDNIAARNRNVTAMTKELLELNLFVSAYIQESKKALESLRLTLANDAKNSQEKTMSTPCKSNSKTKQLQTPSKNSKLLDHHKARTFVQWYKRMIDNNRQGLALYLSDNVTLEWFGRTVKSRKKVASFLKYDMQHTRHDFTTVESIDKVETRQQTVARTELASPNLTSPLDTTEIESKTIKRKLQFGCNSPEWAPGCNPDEGSMSKRVKTKIDSVDNNVGVNIDVKRLPDVAEAINDKGDGVIQGNDHKCTPTTPPNHEVGQGDCMPSTSDSNSNKLHNLLNIELPKLAVECNGYIEFTRSRNNRNTDSMKWDRKSKVQISYSEDQLNIGEYIIWAIRYTDESKCRRNLLATFEKLSNDELLKNVK